MNIMNPQHRCLTFDLTGPKNRKTIRCNECSKVASSDVRVAQITHMNGVPLTAICEHCDGDTRLDLGAPGACVRGAICIMLRVPKFGVIDLDNPDLGCTGMKP